MSIENIYTFLSCSHHMHLHLYVNSTCTDAVVSECVYDHSKDNISIDLLSYCYIGQTFCLMLKKLNIYI